MRDRNGNALVVVLVVICIVAFLYFTGRSDTTDPMPDNPITGVLDISLRYSLLLSGTGVLQIKNSTGDLIEGVTLEYYNQDSGQKQSYSVGTLGARAEREIGILESGWYIEANEVIVIDADGFDPVALYFWKDDQGDLRWSEGYGKKKLGQFLLKMKDARK